MTGLKLLRRLVVAALATIPSYGQQVAETPPLRAEVVGVELVDAGSESVEIDIFVEVEAERATRVRSFSFHRLSANGMPAYIAPLFEPVAIPAGIRVRLPSFRAKFYLRDVSSLDPLRTLLQDARIRIAGTSRVEVELGWLEQLALWSRRGVVWQDFDQSLDVAIPGGLARELSSKAFFAVAGPIVRAGLELGRVRDRWLDQTWTDTVGRLAVVRTSHSYRTRGGGALVTSESLATGVLVSPTRILVPLEAVEPWRFDPATALALDRGDIELAGDIDVEALLPAEGGSAEETFRLSRAELRIDAGRCETERVLLLDENGKTRKAKVCRTAGESNLARLELLRSTARALQPWSPVLPASESPIELATMRLVRGPASGGRWWEIVRLRGQRKDRSIRLAEPIDRSALGAPLLLGGTPVGVIQHEYGGVLLPVIAAGASR